VSGIGVDEEQSYMAVRPVVVVKRRIGASQIDRGEFAGALWTRRRSMEY
jgi:hypothetical protein